MHHRRACGLIVVLTSITCAATLAPAQSSRQPVALSDDGAWCWFQDERAIIVGSKLIVGSVANGRFDAARKGDIDVTVYDLKTHELSRQELHDQLEPDDHAVPALWPAPDGRVIAVYSKHGPENCFYVRTTQSASDMTRWTPAMRISPSDTSRVTYSNLHFLSAENNGRGRLYNFFRGLNASFKPSFSWSDDAGESWKTGNVVIDVPAKFRHRPYVKYASNGRDSIHFLYTNGHPRNYDNSIYHIYYRDGALYRTDGTMIGPLSRGLKQPEEGTCVFRGDADNVAWASDLHLSPAGHPYAVFSVQKDASGLGSSDPKAGQDHRYRYAWWDGQKWHDHELAYAGTRLYAGEDDYTGNICLDPDRLNVVYFSTNAEPRSGQPLVSKADNQRHYELFRATTTDSGATWNIDPITRNSTLDNLRPLVPAWDGRQTALLWFRGVYRTYRDYQTEVAAQFFADPP